ncbi:MAG TPA: hypothetical protein PKW06_00330 [Cyclobacteriaceae bacterium]|nr:hypothetical protein [Cyclobacteriaceae bacterium]
MAEVSRRPHHGFMARTFRVALVAGVVLAATFELYGNHIVNRMKMGAPGFGINSLAFYGYPHTFLF